MHSPSPEDGGGGMRHCLLTRGDKGAGGSDADPEEMARTREKEQRAAAEVLGVRDVEFLNYPDGYLVPDLKLRKDVTAVIRRLQPSIVVTCDPTNFFPSTTYINHPDHRAAGQATLDAISPAAGSGMFFPELELGGGLGAHKGREGLRGGGAPP